MAGRRLRISSATWLVVLERANYQCQWDEQGGIRCGLEDGDIDPIGGGTVRLTPDHKTPHSIDPSADPTDSNGNEEKLLGSQNGLVKRSCHYSGGIRRGEKRGI
jgi:hypothetical protein